MFTDEARFGRMNRPRPCWAPVGTSVSVWAARVAITVSTGCAAVSRRQRDVPVRPELIAEVKFFGRYQRGWIRDGVLLRCGP